MTIHRTHYSLLTEHDKKKVHKMLREENFSIEYSAGYKLGYNIGLFIGLQVAIIIKDFHEQGISKDTTFNFIVRNFNLSTEKATSYINHFWKD